MIIKLINSIFKILVLSLFVIADISSLHAQTAGIIPNAEATFVDKNGKPLTSGKVYFYNPGTTTAKTTWQDINQTTPNTNPVQLDAAGRALIWGNGTYRQQVFDQFNNLQWDNVTAISGASAAGTASGDGNLVGTVLPWSGFIAPPQYMFAYGQSISRTTYSQLLSNLTQKFTITCAGGNSTLNGFSDTTQIPIGGVIEASCLLSPGTVVSKTSTSVTLNVSANVSLVTSATVFPYGDGDGSTTFNLPDYRGYTMVGRCNMGGVPCSSVSSTYYGSDPNALNATGGSQSLSLTTANLPPYTPSGSVSSTSTTNFWVSGVPTAVLTSGGSGANFVGLNTSPTPTIGSVFSTGSLTGTPQGGTSQQFPLIQPSRTVNYIIKVTPDSNVSALFGVSSIAGMSGAINCGPLLNCSGNTIDGIPGSTTGIVGFFAGSGISLSGTCSTNLTGSCTISATSGYVLQTTSFAIDSTYCGKTVQLGNGSSGQFTVTIPSPATVTANCVVDLYNEDSLNGKLWTGAGVPSYINKVLYPKQWIQLRNVNGSQWRATINPDRWRGPFQGSGVCGGGFGACFFVSNSGDDTNDCLSATTPCLTIGRATLQVLQEVDNVNSSPKITIACGIYPESVNIQGPLLSTSVMFLVGASTSTHCVNWRNATAAGSYGLQFGDLMTLEIQNIYFDCSGCTGTNFAIAQHQASILDILDHVEFGSFGTGTMIFIDSNGKINMPASLAISGGAGFFLDQGPQSYVSWGNPASQIVISNTPTFTGLVRMNGNATNTMAGLNWNVGTGIAAGQQWAVTGASYLDRTSVIWPTGSSAGSPAAGASPYGGVVK